MGENETESVMGKNDRKGNVLVIGNSGVGKSTLINAVVGEQVAVTGRGTAGQTNRLEIYGEDDASPFRIIDSVGFEPAFFKRYQAIAAMKKWSRESVEDGKSDHQINVIWFCVEGTSGKLFPQAVRNFLDATKHWPHVPIVVVITKSYSKRDREENIALVQKAFGEVKTSRMPKAIIPVVADTFWIDDDKYAAPDGIDELIATTVEFMPEGLQAAKEDAAQFRLNRKRVLSQSTTAAATLSAVIVGAVPVPIPDATILGPVEIAAITAISKIYGIDKEHGAERFKETIAEVGTVSLFPDFELLLIDDESPDRCPEMCDAWAKKDPRIRALHPAKTGPGPSGARNAGVQAAAAPWLTMVDSDDTIAPDLVEKLLAGAETTGAELVICNGCPVTEDGARHPLPADEQFTKDTLLDVDAFWDAFQTPWINQFTGTAHRLYAARLFDGVRYPVGLLHEDYYVLPDLIAHCSAVYCMAFTGYYVLRHAGSITDGARHEVRLAMTKGDIHRAEYFLRNGWYDRAEGALTDAALFLHNNKRAYDLTKPGHRAEFSETKHELCRVYNALAAQKGSTSMKLRAAALRAGLGVFAMYVRARG